MIFDKSAGPRKSYDWLSLARKMLVWDLYGVFPEWALPSIVRLRHYRIWRGVPENVPIVFVHVPKTGGTTLAHLIYGRPINHYPIWIWHMANRRRFEQCVAVTVLREPCDRVVSAIRHCLGSDQVSVHDLAAGRILRRNGASLEEIVQGYFSDARLRLELSNNVLFKPYGFWLGKREDAPRLRCFALSHVDDDVRTNPRLNVNIWVERLVGPVETIRNLAREVLREDYLWYDDLRNEWISDTSEIPLKLGLMGEFATHGCGAGRGRDRRRPDLEG